MVSTTESVQGDHQLFQKSDGRSLCLPSQPSSPKVLLEISSPLSRSRGRLDIALASGAPVRFFSDSTPSEGDQEDTITTSAGNPGGSMVAEEAMVLDTRCHVSSKSATPHPIGEHVALGPSATSASAETTLDRVALEWRQLLDFDLSVEVTSTILSSRRDATIRIYNNTWKVIHRWCVRRLVDPLSASHKLVLDFLQDGLDRKLKPTTVRRQVAALDSMLLA